jgi:hypothetical protein
MDVKLSNVKRRKMETGPFGICEYYSQVWGRREVCTGEARGKEAIGETQA